MATPATRRHRLQGIGIPFCFAVVVLLSGIGHGQAQIVPVHTTLVYSAATNDVSVVEIKKSDGGIAYRLTLQPEKVGEDVSVFDLVLHKIGDSRNLLEPPGNWHGYQEFMIGAWDFAAGPEKSLYGSNRTFHIAKDTFDLRIFVSKADVRRVSIPNQQNQFVFTGACPWDRRREPKIKIGSS